MLSRKMSTGAKIVTVASQKGGVGKTTTVMNLGSALAKQGKKVLLIDNDPQGNLTRYFGIGTGTSTPENLRTLWDIYGTPKEKIEDKFSIITKGKKGVDLLPSHEKLWSLESTLPNDPKNEYLLSYFLMDLIWSYDVVLIDTPPNLGIFTLNSLCASDYVLIPVEAAYFSMDGVHKIRKVLPEISKTRKKPILILGVLPTKIASRRQISKKIIGKLRDELGSIMFENAIHEYTAVTESSGRGKSILDFRSTSNGAKDYIAAAEEFTYRIDVFEEMKREKAREKARERIEQMKSGKIESDPEKNHVVPLQIEPGEKTTTPEN